MLCVTAEDVDVDVTGWEKSCRTVAIAEQQLSASWSATCKATAGER